MTAVVAIVLIAHGLFHLLGFAVAFGFAELPQLTEHISPLFGLLWLIAGLLFLGAAGSLFFWPRWWWAIGMCAIAVSMVVIVVSWSDAKFGTVANVVVLVGAMFGFLAQGPASLRAAYDRDVGHALARPAMADLVTDEHLAHLPPPVQRYLRVTGVVGHPASTTFVCACGVGSGMVPRRDGSRSWPNSTTLSTNQRDCST